jgi:hypothetical protein
LPAAHAPLIDAKEHYQRVWGERGAAPDRRLPSLLLATARALSDPRLRLLNGDTEHAERRVVVPSVCLDEFHGTPAATVQLELGARVQPYIARDGVIVAPAVRVAQRDE